MEKIFAEVGEKEVTEAIVSEFSKQFLEYIESDCIIVGGGPSGLIAGIELAKDGFKTLVIEKNNYLGGGFWIGGYLMNKTTLRAPGQEILLELGVPCEEVKPGLFVADAPHCISKLIARACDCGVKFLQLTMLDDLVLKEENRVSGVVVNWTPVSSMPKAIACVDPIALTAKVTIDATGHDASCVKKLEERGLIKTKGCGAMWISASEDLVVEHTKEAYPGLIVIGMATATTYGLPRMGPTFSAMFFSGKKGAEIAKEITRSYH
ncbi:TPA: ribose 1,5-bisphosphate isomerase [bacterium]|nr:ribose 1,5-bisphosphate isomerase [bacterium]